ncbi:hypothetical protein PSHT_07357 [Puccinia striiformis]|uniref:Fungal-type protein kinase domain-containing protein n=1 Tax=Puccinia striiformis TaxID=27350 RepID=A0A2S4VYL9_9BASI|nr:hypothetical protein PSHT_07357 [Puccinia striiformis]
MAQVVVQQEESLQGSLRKHLNSAGINTLEEFNRLDESEIAKQIKLLQEKFLTLDVVPELIKDAFTTMINLDSDAHFDHFQPLITLILANEVKSNQEICELISTECERPPTSSHYISTTVGTDTTRDTTTRSSELNDSIPLLKRKLNELMYQNVPGLVEHFINKVNIDPAFLLKPHESFINQKHEEIISDRSEAFMLKWITSLFTHYTIWLDQQSSKSRDYRAWWTDPAAHWQNVEAKRKLNGAIVSHHPRVDNHEIDILVPFALKKHKSNPSRAAIALSKHVWGVFSKQPTRSFVLGLTLCGTSIQLWQFDRSGAIGSELIDVKANKENLNKLFILILSLLTCSEQDLGFDPTFIDLDWQACVRNLESKKIQIITKHGTQELVIDRLNYRTAGICGRGTTCWEAHLPGDESQKFLIKDSWQPEHQRAEGDMLRDVTEKNVPHVARYYHHQDVHMAGRRVDIQSHVRGGINFETGQKIDYTDERVPMPAPKDFINRVHRRLVLKDVGQPIWTVDSPVRLLEALEDCIKGHQALFNAGILHRDISVNNLMIDNQTEDPDRKSFLIDLDMAVPYPMTNEEDSDARIGTKECMSIGLLMKTNSHTHLDDLESFFWVLIWTCVHWPVDQRGQYGLRSWNDLSPWSLGASKYFYLRHTHELTEKFTPRYKESQPLLDCVVKLAEIMCNPPVGENELAAAHYRKVLDVLREAQGKPKLSPS